MRVDRTVDELLPDLDPIALADPQVEPAGHRVGDLLAAVVGDDDNLARLVGVFDPDPAGHLADRRLALGDPGLEQLDNTRQALRDVVTRHTTGVEGTHRQLGAGLTDRLGGDDTDRLADIDQLAGGQGAPVALGAGPDPAVAGEDRADLHLTDTLIDQLADEHVTQVDTGLGDHVAL